MTVKSEGHIAFWLVLWATVFGLTIVYAIDNAEGAWTANTYNTTTQVIHNQGKDSFIHTKDDQYAVVYTSSSDDLWCAHKSTTGGSWEYALIDGSYGTYRTVGVVCSSNNTLVAWVQRTESGTPKGYAYVKWPGDDWDTWTAYYVYGVSGFSVQDLAINNTDDICLMSSYGSNTYARIFNLTTKTVTATSTTFYGGSNAYSRVEANQSGDFWVLAAGYGSNLYFRDYNKTIGAITITGYWYYPELVCLSNDRFGFTAYYVFGALQRYVYWAYQHTHAGGFTKVIIDAQPGTHSWTYPKCGITQDSLTVWAFGLDSTDTKLYDWHASWNAVAATWQSSENEISSGSTYYALGASNSVWPRTAGVSWCQPKTGQAFHVFYETGATDTSQIWTQGISWTPDLTTDWPSITTAALPEGTYGTHYSYSLSKSGGTAPFTWSILSGPAWLSIGASNGTIYGDPTGVGTTAVTIKLEDAIPRPTQKEFSLKINPAVADGLGDVTETFSAEDLELASLWLILAITAIGVGLAREYKKITNPPKEEYYVKVARNLYRKRYR